MDTKKFLIGALCAGVLLLGGSAACGKYDEGHYPHLSAGEIYISARAEGKKDRIEQIARPWLGVYECRRAYFGGEDKLAEFSRLDLELRADGKAVLSYKDKKGVRGRQVCDYLVDVDKNEITFETSIGGVKKKKCFPYIRGEIDISVRCGGRQAELKFVHI